MDINIRDWMMIIGVLLILAVLLDGYRRMRRDPNKVRVSLAKVPEGNEEEVDVLFTGHELPNGGARVIDRDEDEFAAQTADEVVMMYVTARHEAGFSGEDILHILLACNMRFGELNFFHRHESAAGKGRVQFSVANMMQPGMFDVDTMSDFSTQGLTFFLTLPGPRNMMAAFEAMLETAECVAKNLEGDLLDESRSVATKQTREHIRQRIRDLERRLVTHGHH